MFKRLVHRNLLLMVGLDSALVVACFFSSYLIRFDFAIPANDLDALLRIFTLVLPVKIGTFGFFRLYRGMWRYTSLADLMNVVKAVFTSSALIILVVLMVYRFEGYPRSVFIIDGALTLLAIAGLRVAIRLYFARGSGIPAFPAIHMKESPERRLIIIGAGDAGEQVLREIYNNPGLRLQPVGLLDDSPGKRGKTIHGVRVLGTVEEINDLPVDFDDILIAVPSAKPEQMRRIVAACESTGKRYLTVPGIGELIDGRVSIKTIRRVFLEDLFGREEVHLDQEGIARYLSERRVLVTGAGGSIGSELVRQMSQFDPQAVALLEFSELNLFRMDMECRQRFEHLPISIFLVDVRDRQAVEHVFKEFKPQVVFHAAAYKHVPIQEKHPWAAVFNNVLGTRNLVESSMGVSVERFVLVSTDKAVRPTNVMGATKRVAEMFVESMNGSTSTRFIAVRFGNVVGSSGSAVRIFQEQIARGGPVTVTHPEVTRYFMSIPEAAQLILQAGAMDEEGEIFILDMGRPMNILDMAKEVIRLHGFEPDADIPIQFIGLRPGEKLNEELITDGEGVVATAHEKILVLRGDHWDPRKLNAQIDELLTVARTFDASAIKCKLQQLVPEYTPQL